MSSQASLGHAHPRLLTFGVEFEFLVAVCLRILDPHPGDGRWIVPLRFGLAQGPNDDSVKRVAQDFIKSLLESNMIPALSGHRYEISDIEYVQGEVVSQGVHPHPTPNQVAIHAFWMVSDDQSVHRIEGEDIDGYGFVDMEVSSRILSETDFAEVEKVYSLIQNNIRTQVNSSCGLHYHIGIGHLSLESVKKLVTLVMVAEDRGLFRRICARHRSSPTNLWCQPVSEFSRAAMRRDGPPRLLLNRNLEFHLPQRHEISRDLLLALSQIWDCGHVDEIAEQTLTCNSRPSAAYGFSRPGGFAIRRLKVEPDIEGNLVNSDRTIEFRYKESTGSTLEDYHWLQLCLQLVRVAEWSEGRFRAVMGTLSTTDALDGLLLVLGIGANEVQWWLTIAERHRAHQNPVKRSQFLVPENVSSSGLV